MNRYLVMLTLSLVISQGADAVPEQLKAEIDRLMGAVAESDCTFVRNGKHHTAKESVKHILRKYAHFEDDIDSIESFVALTATRSLMSGKDYQVRCNGVEQASEVWMLRKAEELGLNIQAVAPKEGIELEDE